MEKTLNELCDEKLLMARYTNGIEEYYERMTSLIPGEWLAEELLESLYATSNSYSWNYETNNDQTLKLIKEYKDAKSKR